MFDCQKVPIAQVFFLRPVRPNSTGHPSHIRRNDPCLKSIGDGTGEYRKCEHLQSDFLFSTAWCSGDRNICFIIFWPLCRSRNQEGLVVNVLAECFNMQVNVISSEVVALPIGGTDKHTKLGRYPLVISHISSHGHGNDPWLCSITGISAYILQVFVDDN